MLATIRQGLRSLKQPGVTPLEEVCKTFRRGYNVRLSRSIRDYSPEQQTPAAAQRIAKQLLLRRLRRFLPCSHIPAFCAVALIVKGITRATE